MLVVDIKRTVDMSPLKRIRLRSHAASELKAKGSMRARERRAHVGISQISGSEKSIFVLSLVLPPQALKLLVPGGARPDHRHGPTCFSFITLTRRSSFGTGNYGLA